MRTALPRQRPDGAPSGGEELPPAAEADASSSAPARRAVLRLKPKCGGRFFAGAPWVYANEVVLDRRTKALPPGEIATLVDADRRPVATVATNVTSRIAARRLSSDPEAEIDGAWLEARLSRALALRERLFDAPFYRLAHAEADGLPGLVIDRYGDVLVLQPNAAWLDRRRTQLLAALERVLSPEAIIWSAASRARSLEGLPEEVRLLKGAVDGPIETPLNGARYLADVVGGQKTGLYFDQRENHAFVRGLSDGRRVLDVFSHVGGFGLAALAGGAASALMVDGSEAALELARAGAARMGAAERLQTRRGDAFDVMRALDEEGERFDVVICDPPAFAPSRAALEQGARGYAKTARAGLRLAAPGGLFVLCSCSHAMDALRLRETAADALRRARRSGRLIRAAGAGPDHPVHPHLPETEYLKCLVFQLD